MCLIEEFAKMKNLSTDGIKTVKFKEVNTKLTSLNKSFLTI